MASSELEVEPDLNKAPPHVEGELLKQNTKAFMGYKSWKKYYFIVLKDKLQYFDKREDSKQSKEPIAFIRMSQVTSITEVVFNGVPKKHHLNCGFSVEAFHPVTQQQITLNLLAETPEDMRYWVHALRYIKAYWAKKMIRETVLNEEQERKILERILSGDLGDEELIPGRYTLDEDASQPPAESASCPIGSAISVYFADGLKPVKLSLLPTDTTSDLLDKEEVKEHLTSSAAHVWLVDSLGNDMILGASDNPGLFPGKTHKLFVLDHTQRVLPIFFNKKEYECIVVSPSITATQIMEHHDVCVQLDLQGVTNRGLFLKNDTEEHMFTGQECPCDVLFELTEDRNLIRQCVGKLVVHNKALGGGRATNAILKRTGMGRKRTMIKTINAREHKQQMEDISEEEEAQSKALDMLYKKRVQRNVPQQSDVQIRTSLSDKTDVPRPLSFEVIDEEPWNLASIEKGSSPNSPDHKSKEGRGLEDAIIVGVAGKKGGSPIDKRHRSSAMSDIFKGRSNRLNNSSPSDSPSTSPARVRSRSKSPRRKLPEGPSQLGGSSSESSSPHSSPLQRRNATRVGSITRPKDSNKRTRLDSLEVSNTSPVPSIKMEREPTTKFTPGKGPTIRHASPLPGEHVLPPSHLDVNNPPLIQRAKSPSFSRTGDISIDVGKSRSSAFGFTASTPPSTDAEGQERSISAHSSSTQQIPPAPSPVPTPKPSEDPEQETTPTSETEDSPVILRPFVIDFTSLQVAQSLPVGVGAGQEAGPEAQEEKELSSSVTIKALPITTPNLLKVILLQSSEAMDSTEETKPMDLISLSGVALRNNRGVWHLQEGCNFHDSLPFDSKSHTETFQLPGGIRAVYNHTEKRWHVLPPIGGGVVGGGADLSTSYTDPEGSLETSDGSVTTQQVNTLLLSKKVVVTDIGSAFHTIIALFTQTRDNAEKKRIGSDMTNPQIGHMIRGQFCSALARLMLDGLRPYRLQGIVQDDIWDVTMAFCSAAQSDPTSSLVTPAIDKLIFQPIHAMKTAMRDNNVKFRTFVCLAMSKGMLTGWLEALPKQRSVLRKYYLPSALLSLAADDALYKNLYQEMLLALEPMAYLPFDLGIEFELRGQSTGTGGGVAPVESIQGSREDVSSGNHDSASPQNSLRPNVVIKTHAATGQRSTAGNVVSVVWDTSPLHSPKSNTMATNPSHTDETDGGSNRSNQPAVSTNRPSQQTGSVVGGSFLKKLSERFQQLNMGGAITGAPKAPPGPQVAHKQEPRPQKPPGGEKMVEALYTNICDDNDELSFAKGDHLVVKEQINSEWLLCSLGNKTGIVPTNYIKLVS